MSIPDKALTFWNMATGYILSFLASTCSFYKNNRVKQIFSDGAVDHGKQIYFSDKQSNQVLSLTDGEKLLDKDPYFQTLTTEILLFF